MLQNKLDVIVARFPVPLLALGSVKCGTCEVRRCSHLALEFFRFLTLTKHYRFKHNIVYFPFYQVIGKRRGIFRRRIQIPFEDNLKYERSEPGNKR